MERINQLMGTLSKPQRILQVLDYIRDKLREVEALFGSTMDDHEENLKRTRDARRGRLASRLYDKSTKPGEDDLEKPE
tara:strand:- start:112 stop:345 length:234 start_codon:yes stop_codon:yes gene_type:complete